MKSRTFVPNNGDAPATKTKSGTPGPLAVRMPLPAFSNSPRPASTSDAPVEPSDTVVSYSQSSATFIDDDIQEILIDLIDANPFAPREIYTAEMLASRANEIRVQGQNDAIHVIPNPDEPGRYIIADGWTRVQACRAHLERKTLKAKIHHGLTVQEAAWLGYQQNEGREPQCDFDRAMFFEKLIAEGQVAAEVARRAGIPKATMSMYRSFAKLPTEILQFVKDKPRKFGHRAAYELNRIHEAQGIRKAVAVAAKYCDEDQTHRWLVNQTQAALHPTKHKAQTALKHIRYANGYYKQKADAFELSIQVPPEKREAFSSALEALLNTVAVEDQSSPQPSETTDSAPPGQTDSPESGQ